MPIQLTQHDRIHGWIAALVFLALTHAPSALAQVYKCTDAGGRTAYSDKPCPTQGGAAGPGAKGAPRQEVLKEPAPVPASSGIGSDAASTMCAQNAGSKANDATIQALPERQRDAVRAAVRGVISALARDPNAQEAMKRVTLHIDASRNAVLCVPQQRAQSPGGPVTTTYFATRVEPNGRTETLLPGAKPLVTNDANEPSTVAERCSVLITSCVRSKTPGASIDECFDKQPACPAGRLDATASCCPQACKDAYRRERASGTEAINAMLKTIFGDDKGAQSCIPGMPRKGPA